MITQSFSCTSIISDTIIFWKRNNFNIFDPIFSLIIRWFVFSQNIKKLQFFCLKYSWKLYFIFIIVIKLCSTKHAWYDRKHFIVPKKSLNLFMKKIWKFNRIKFRKLYEELWKYFQSNFFQVLSKKNACSKVLFLYQHNKLTNLDYFLIPSHLITMKLGYSELAC